jgi:hypothetical protein
LKNEPLLEHAERHPPCGSFTFRGSGDPVVVSARFNEILKYLASPGSSFLHSQHISEKSSNNKKIGKKLRMQKTHFLYEKSKNQPKQAPQKL